MKLRTWSKLAFVFATVLALAAGAQAQYLMENLGRGVVAIRQNATDVYVGWRLSGTDPAGVAFNLYRSTGGGPAIQLNGAPITDSTNFVDSSADLTQSNAYFVRPVVNGVERTASASFTLPANAPAQQYLNIPLQIPAGGTTPDGVNYTYTANDASVGDVDGDGEYEIILKWEPTNAKDNSQSGYTGNVYLDAYKLNGTRLWRIDLGRNIRAGAHYTQFMVYDLDGDGKAELACKTAPGTVDGAGNFVLLGSDNPAADYRNSSGYVLSGPEYLTVFNGLTGAALATVSYNPPRGNVGDWGDTYGNRVDRFLAGIAYLDGKRPSLVMARGYYTRAFVAAWDWRDGQLTNRWNFDTGFSGGPYSAWRGQGAHSLTIGDVDADGKDEITYGAAGIDDNGTGLYSTNLGHGDALHMSDMDPDRPGQEVYMVHESPSSYGANGSEFRDAKTGALIFGVSGEGADVGRGVAGDIDPNHRGSEVWSSRGGLWSSKGYNISTARPGQMNFMIWWDADRLREIEDGTTISKWNWTTNTVSPLLAPSGISSNNSTKATPALLGDILGDWREEVIWRTNDNTALRIYTTTIPAQNRIYTLMHDHQYRVAVAWQNTAYNQPPHPSFFIGHDMAPAPKPNIVTKLNAKIAAITSITDDTGAASDDEITSDAALILSGTAGANDTVTLTLEGAEIGSTTADAAGNWSFDYTNTPLAEGAHTFKAVATDVDGVLTPESEPFTVNIDTTAPLAPAINSVAGGGSFVFKGTAEPGATVTVVRANAGPIGSGVAGQNGAWVVTYSGSLPQGVYTFTAAAADTAGNTSPASSEYTVDTGVTTPLITHIVSDTGALANDGITSDTTLVINGTASAGHTVTVSRGDIGVIGAVAADGSGNWSFDYTNTVLPAGTYTFTARAASGAGDGSLSSPDFVVTVEETPPAVLSINRQNPLGATINNGTVVFRVTFSEPVSGVDSSDFQLTLTGSTTGAIGATAPVSSSVYDVAVNSIMGTGTVRLDLKASGTGITDLAGNVASGGYTAGQTYIVTSNVSGVWSQLVSGGLWSSGANWQGNAVANGAGFTADFSQLNITGTNLVRLDSPRALSNITFGDTTTSSAGSWIIDGNGDPNNGFALSPSTAAPTITVNALGTGATATIATPVSVTGGLTKAGAGTLVLAGANTLGSGAVNINAGAIQIASGGSFTTTGLITAVTSPFIVNGGAANIGSFRTNSDFSGTLRINAGTLNVGDVNIRRNSAAAPDFASGFIIAGGTATATTVQLGTANSTGAMSVEGGSLTATGAVTVGNQTTGGRGGALRVTSGVFNSTEAANGIILSRTNGSNANNVAAATFSGGTSTVEKFTLGFDSTVNAGSATITLSGGALYVGTGGIVKKGAGSFTSAINLSGGTLGAAADWTTTHPMTLTNTVTIKAADATDLPQDITLAGVLSGAGAINKTGTGTLILAGANTNTGATTVNAGTLRVNGSIAAGAGAFNVNDGATLSGNGSVNRAVTLNAGGTLAPEGATPVATLGASALTWNGGAQFAYDLAAAGASDKLALTGALTKGGAGAYEFVFSPGAALADGMTYTLATFGSTNFTAADFSYSGLPPGVNGFFKVNANSLQFIIDSTAPSVYCPADITTAAAASASSAVVNYTATANDAVSDVTVTGSPASGSAFNVGTTTVNVTATDAAGNTSACSFTVTVRATPVVSVATPAPVQYSDAVTLQANVSAAAFPGQPLAGSVQFFVNGSPVGQSALADGVATLQLPANMAAGVYNVTAQFTSANPASYTDGSGGPVALTVNKENAATSYTGDSALLTSGPNVSTATVRLGAHLVPEADGAGFVGDITKATVTFELFKSNNLGATPDLVVSNVPVGASGDAQVVVNSLAADLYTINVKVDGANQYWTANPFGVGVLSVVVPSEEQRSSGGGWVSDAASRDGKSNFGFNVRAANKAGAARGNFTFTLPGADGFNYVLKSNTWQDGYLQFAAEPGVTPETYTRGNFKGRASLFKFDPATGVVVATLGNYTFEVFNADGDLLTPRRADALAITIWDGAGQVWHQVGTPQTLVTIGGGNVMNKAK